MKIGINSSFLVPIKQLREGIKSLLLVKIEKNIKIQIRESLVSIKTYDKLGKSFNYPHG